MTTALRSISGRASVTVRQRDDALDEVHALREEGRQMGQLVPLARFVRQHVDDIRAEQAAGIIVLSLERMARRHPSGGDAA